MSTNAGLRREAKEFKEYMEEAFAGQYDIGEDTWMQL